MLLFVSNFKTLLFILSRVYGDGLGQESNRRLFEVRQTINDLNSW